MRLTRYQRRIIFQALLAEAHAKTARGLTGQDIVRASEHVKRDLFGLETCRKRYGTAIHPNTSIVAQPKATPPASASPPPLR